LGGVAAASLSLASPAHATFPGKNGRLVFSAVEPNENQDIYTINPDGSGLTRLTNTDALEADTAEDYEAKWSPDGTKIAFARSRNSGTPRVYAMNPDGTGLRQLSDRPSGDPAWSPDGSKIAFTAELDPPDGARVFIANSDGRRLTNLIQGQQPVWSPDGKKIAFIRVDENGLASLFTVNLDGSGETLVASGNPYFPTWAPGPRILFVREGGIFAVDPDGSGETRLSGPFSGVEGETWSPDGMKIAFSRELDGIWVMNADGSSATRLAQGGFRWPVWSPDGTKIAFPNGGGKLFLMNPDGTQQTLITEAIVVGNPPDWQPLPEPKRSDYHNAAQFCKAVRAFLGDAAFAQKYGGPKSHFANAFGKCVSRN
jgi:TolB protein